MMPILSRAMTLRSAMFNQFLRNRIFVKKYSKQLPIWNVTPVRPMGSIGPKKMAVTISTHETKQFFDDVMYWFIITSVPLALLVFYVNTVYGYSRLEDIPEGYEPKDWEYERHPIQRWYSWMRGYTACFQWQYEREAAMHYQIEMERQQKKLRMKARSLMMESSDYNAWYYLSAPTYNLAKTYRQWEKYDKP